MSIRANDVLADVLERFDASFGLAPVGMAIISAESSSLGRYLEVNPSLCTITGYSSEDLLATTFQAITYPDDLEAGRQYLEQALLGEQRSFQTQKRHVHADGRLVWALVTTWAVPDSEGPPLCFFTQVHDITAAKRAEEESDNRQQLLSAVLEHLEEGIVACDAEGNLTLFNRAAREFHGLPLQVQPPERWREQYSLYRADGTTPMEAEDFPLFQALTGRTVRGVEMVIAPQSGTARTLVANGQPLLDAHGRKLGAVVAMRDLTAQREAQSRLEHQSLHDALTGLPNRALFVDRAAQALERDGRRHGSTAVLFLDIDRLRAINDSLGYEVGNEILVVLAERLQRALRPEDTVARLGGDEFAILCENVADERFVMVIAERTLEAIRQPVRPGGQDEVSVTARLGVALSSPEDEAADLLRDAELALRRAKDEGTEHELFSTEMRADTLQRIEDEKALRRALDEDQLLLHYQPLVALESDRIVGTEALLRWEHPERGLVPPLDFIPLAEETGLIVPIGAWVIEEATRQAAEWQASFPGRPPVRVSVNVSAGQFRSALVDTVRELLDRTHLDPETLCLEVTESILMDDLEDATATLAGLKALGVEISVDDFGTGYSSLAYLRRFPLDELKVDRSFVDGLGRDPEDTAIVGAVTAMAHALELRVVGEGVETPEQLRRLRVLGCELAQGYHLSRPLSAAGLEKLLVAENAAALGAGSAVLNHPSGSAGPRSNTVVIADDSPDVLQLAAMSLVSAGYEVHGASNGEEAIALAGELRPGCVILDVEMPDLNGIEVCRRLRGHPSTSASTIMMLTSKQDSSDKIKAFSAGADDYVLKPFSPRDLVSRVRAAIRRRSNGPGPLPS